MRKFSLILTVLLALVLVVGTVSARGAAETAPAEEEGIWTMFEIWEQWPEEEAKLNRLREVAAAPARRTTARITQPVKIAFVWPSFDLSEGWARGAISFRARIAEFGFPFEITEFGSEIDQHDVQASHLETIMAQDFDFVLVGPTELDVQSTLIQDMIAKPGLEVILWNYNTPLRRWGRDRQPWSYVGFDHAEGGAMLADWVTKEVGNRGTFATMRFVPGFLDDQRVGTFSGIAESRGMRNVYDHFADGTQEKAYEGTAAALARYPDLVHIHASNTATALGTLAALREQGRAGQIILNGWGGGDSELDAMFTGDLHVTPMRMQDDFGIFPAEIIRMHLEGRQNDIPLVAAGEIILVDHRMTRAQVQEIRDYAYRYSGVLER